MHFGHKSRAISLLFLNEIIPLAIPYHSSPIPMSMQSLKKIGQKVLKLEHGNQVQSILTRAITLLFQNEISPLATPYHSSPILMSRQSLKKIGQNVLKLEHGNECKAFLTNIKGLTLLFQNEISPLAIPYHSSPIPMSMQSLKKISQKVLKLKHGNKVQSIFDIHQVPYLCCFRTKLAHLQLTTPPRYQCLCKV